MIFRKSHPLFLLACATVVVCPFVHRASAQEQQFADANCAITLSADWEDHTPTKDKPEYVLAAFGTHDRSHDLVVSIYDHGKSSEPMGILFIKTVDRMCAAPSGAGHKVSGRLIEFAGVRCYERRGVLNLRDRRVSTLVRAIPTGEGMYFLKATVIDDEIEAAPDVQQAMASFRFLHPPPASKIYGADQPLGYYGILVLVVVLLIVVALCIVGFCLRLDRHFRTAAYMPHRSIEGEPPPLPSAPTEQPPGPYDY